MATLRWVVCAFLFGIVTGMFYQSLRTMKTLDAYQQRHTTLEQQLGSTTENMELTRRALRGCEEQFRLRPNISCQESNPENLILYCPGSLP